MTWVKLRTWWRIQSRMFLIYAAEVYLVLEWPLRMLVNYMFLLLMPAWIGIVYFGMYIKKAWKSKKNVERSVLTGKIWFWSAYRMY